MRRLGWTLGGTALFWSVLASAASLGGIADGRLGADDAGVPACDTNGFTVAYTTSGGNVTAVAVSGIADPGCEGGDLSLAVTQAGTSIGSGGPQIVPTDGDVVDNSMSVSVSPNPDAALVDGISITVAGP